jgi:hypothetical protein
MTSITSKTIGDYLRQIGWSHSIVDDGRVLTGFRGAVPFYDYPVPLEITIRSHWVYIRACLHRQASPEHTVAILRLIAALNATCHVVRFVLTEGTIIVQAEIPVVHCHLGSFSDALTAIYRYTSRTGLELAVLSSNASVAKLFETVNASLGTQSFSNSLGATLSEAELNFEIPANRLTV